MHAAALACAPPRPTAPLQEVAFAELWGAEKEGALRGLREKELLLRGAEMLLAIKPAPKKGKGRR